jgi:TPR repeat protein
MASVRELIEAGQPPRENERALVVMDETTEGELELSFYDHQQGRFIGPDGLTSEPHFFRATVARISEKRGYLVGPEVTRCLRLRALIGIASRQGPLGDVPSDVRTYRRIEHGATIDIPANRVEISKDLEPSGGDGRGAGGGVAGDTSAGGAAALGAGGAVVGASGGRPQPLEIHSKRETQQWRRFAVTAGLLIPLIVAATFALARLGWYSLVISVNGSLDFFENARQSASEPVVFTPESTSIEIRRALWARPFEGWWISKRPPAQIEFDKDGYWLNTHDQSPDRGIIVVLRPNTTTQSTAATVLRTQLTFRNTDTGQVFATREATLRLATAPADQLHIAADPLVFTGFKGGPFNPESAQIGLSASGRDVRWSVQNIPSWIELTGGPAGKLNKDGSVTLTVTPRAANLAPGPYDARLTFRNDDTNTVTEKSIRLVVLDAALECDRRTATRFDPDRPATAPFVEDIGTLSDADLDAANRACAAAFLGDSSSAASRRFVAEMGRAYAARAVRLARSRDDTGARATMSDAVRLWREAATKGSTAAMNFLGSYWAGLYDDAVDPSASNKCRSEPPRFSFAAADMTMARDYWERAAKANPANAEAMSNYGGLLITAPDLCPARPDLQNISEGISWLKQAVDRGNLGAAEVLGELFYRGRAPSSSAPNDSFPKNVDEGLRWLAMACKDGNVRAKDFVTRMISTTKEMDPAKRPPGC